LQSLKESLGINYDKITAECKNGHKVKVHEGIIPKKDNRKVECSFCQYPHLELHERFYRCEVCDFNLCSMCTVQKSGILNKRIFLTIHGHQLRMATEQECANAWMCDGYSKSKSRQCESGVTFYNQGFFL
jgi:hypothetical protein